MDKFNSSSATPTFQVGESSSGTAALIASRTDNITATVSEKPRVRHQHSQSMDGLMTIKPEILTLSGEETSSAEIKETMSAVKLAELALIDQKCAKR
ncbi:hypothetical protein FXO38_27787 [Capsicum annuum]|uniref:Uncharacterized protein n=1 Tax=Capsicum annuum TaxID=4072 RepID=A0A2G3AN79_CAPAN|nr:hypothetical protein FXO38_27787 [Capsicum annuum]KAF3631357.1 hypothetical protein FXO37_28016 [Capsicum annuum]PHT95686.1 hypothetical protein T459_03568 [Capsicum annuum]